MNFAVVAVMAMAVACSSRAEAPLVEDIDTWFEDLRNTVTSEVMEISEDTSKSEEVRQAAVSAKYEAAIDEMKAKTLSLLEDFPSSEAVVAALKNTVVYFEKEEVEEMLGKLKGAANEDEFVRKLQDALDAVKSTAEGKKFTDFTVVQDESDPEGSTVKFSDFVGRGKFVLVDFWASWCGPCKRELPNIAAIYEKYKGDDFDVLSIAVWDKPADTKEAAAEHGIVWSQIINAQQIPTEIYGIDGIPHIMLIGPDGTILKRNLRGADIGKAVSEALGR